MKRIAILFALFLTPVFSQELSTGGTVAGSVGDAQGAVFEIAPMTSYYELQDGHGKAILSCKMAVINNEIPQWDAIYDCKMEKGQTLNELVRGFVQAEQLNEKRHYAEMAAIRKILREPMFPKQMKHQQN